MDGRKSDHPDAAGQRYLSTAQAAGALGVSVTTIKRWVDDGVLAAHRTVGRHRKLLASDVFRLARDGNPDRAEPGRTPTAPPAGAPDPDRLRDDFVAAARAGDADGLRALVTAGYLGGLSVETLADRVLAPGLRQVGHDWEVGRLEVLHEHRASQACVSAVYGLQPLLRAAAAEGRPVAVGGAPENDHYILPTLLAMLTLLDGGWDATNLGPHTPMSALHSALDELRPTLVWLSITRVDDPDRFLTEYSDFFRHAEARGAAVAVGGQGLGVGLRARMAYTSFGDGLTHLAAFARSLTRPVSR